MAHKYSVLYVDDEPDLLDLGRLFLEQSGRFTVTTAGSGTLALEMMEKQAFDAIVSDYQMPECNGLRLLRHVRQDSDIPFILFTGKGREEVVIEAINTGVDFYLQKGGDTKALFAELGHKIIQAISRRRVEHALHRQLELIRLTSVTATEFLQLSPNQIDRAIERLLGDIGEQAGADHCYVTLETKATGEIDYAYEWVSPGNNSLKEQIGPDEIKEFSSVSQRIHARETINVPSVASMEDTDEQGVQKKILQERGIKSFLLLPLMSGSVLMGSLGFDTTRNEISWSDEDIDIFMIFGQIIASTLARKTADKALHDSEELYRTVFESTGTAMMILGEDKTVIRANREMERISGYSRQDIENKMKWTKFVSPPDLERMKQYHDMRRADPTSVPTNYEFGFLSGDGRTIATYITVEMIPGTKKSIVSLIDISKEKEAIQELADSEEKFRSLTGSLAEGIYMIQDNHFIYVNPAFSRITGWSADELKALPDFTLIFPEEEQTRVKKSVDDRLAGILSSERYTVNARHKKGFLFPVTIHGSLTRYKGKPAIIGTIIAAEPA
jgi:PAS domain S-box-containing protein